MWIVVASIVYLIMGLIIGRLLQLRYGFNVDEDPTPVFGGVFWPLTLVVCLCLYLGGKIINVVDKVYTQVTNK